MDRLTEENIKKHLNTKTIGKNIIYFETVDSTNAYAKNAGGSLEDGTVITCGEQTTGRGRLGRKWESQKGMCMSILLKPNVDLHHVPQITQVCAAAVSLALEELEIDTKIKWPNDIYLNGKKICGILTEMKTEMNNLSFIIIGIGMNVINEAFPEEIKNTASSIFLETGKKVEKIVVAAKILNNFEILYNEFIKGNFKTSLDICRKKSYVLGKEISLIENGNITKATALDLGSEGELVVRYEDGRTENVISGEISVRLM